jgi:hypothetical protein
VDLADAIRHHPEAAAVVLERLEYVITRPVVTTAVATAGDRQHNRRPTDAPDGS